tara:strand:- start:6326 stop:7492 length:1167 start_codon:yes stop_codon:yes gene_type:complete
MLTKNISFKNFSGVKIKKSIFVKKTFFDKNKLIQNYPLLKSFFKDYNYSYKKNDLKKFKKYKNIRIIGMGGSILGIEAIHQFLKHKVKKNLFFLNNLRPYIKNKKKALNIVISKSGETLETISNFHILHKRKKNQKNVFITEKSNNYINILAHQLKDDVFEHKNYIGGRYSVLSEVGMLPAELMGLNEKKFKQLNYLIKNKIFINNLISNVKSTIGLIKKKKFNSIILNYDENSDNFFRWYQQLIAESLGKKSKGIVPLISTMPKDNHSLLQLYLDGPRVNFFTFFNVKNDKTEIVSNKISQRSKMYLKNKNLSQIIDAQRIATERIFLIKKLPFRSFTVLKRSEESIGELFCFFVLETILLGKALEINPFDQPSVELIKVETKKILT